MSNLHGTFTKAGGFSDRQKNSTTFSAEQEKAYQEIRKNEEDWRYSFCVSEYNTQTLPIRWQRRLAL